MASVMGLRNHEDSKRKSAATKAGLRRVAEWGRRNGGVPGYGYRWVPGPVDEKGKQRQRLVPDEVTAPVVRRIYADYLTGAGSGIITARWRDEGVPPPRANWDRHTIAFSCSLLRLDREARVVTCPTRLREERARGGLLVRSNRHLVAYLPRLVKGHLTGRFMHSRFHEFVEGVADEVHAIRQLADPD